MWETRIGRQQAPIKSAIISGSDVSARRDATKVAAGSEHFTASWHFQLWKVWEFAGRNGAPRRIRLRRIPRDRPTKYYTTMQKSLAHFLYFSHNLRNVWKLIKLKSLNGLIFRKIVPLLVFRLSSSYKVLS